MKFKPHEYQKRAIEHILNHRYCALWLDMGLGKSAITLSAITELLLSFAFSKVLIVAPKKVAETTWQSEIKKWSDFNFLPYSTIMGTPKQREAAASSSALIHIIGRDSVVWLVNHFKDRWPYDMVVLDESTSFKNPCAMRFKALKKVRPKIERLVELTGTPSPNGLEDLWSQIYLLDLGERLGSTLTGYRTRYFQVKEKIFGMFVKYEPKKGADKAVVKAVSDIVLSMKSEDYLSLPDAVYSTQLVKLDEKSRKAYSEMEKEELLKVDETTIEAMSAASLMNKLLQLSNGAVYDCNHFYHLIHDCKLDALVEMIESLEGQSVLVFYSYLHDAIRIMDRIKDAKIYKSKTDLEDWNSGKIKIMLAHPSSTAYGLNMQEGGNHIIWFGLTWNLELYSQANARLHRQGQKKTVFIHHLVVEGTKDEQVMKALERKDKAQDFLIESLKVDIRRAKCITEKAG